VHKRWRALSGTGVEFGKPDPDNGGHVLRPLVDTFTRDEATGTTLAGYGEDAYDHLFTGHQQMKLFAAVRSPKTAELKATGGGIRVVFVAKQ
ncbi:MAG TPA: hypothetical protein VLJ39_10860, partial [Tepidisphaeraceae bacterium]|nr:hypothetical protein [Tepidisphaeraceae bacterium]